MTKVLTIVGARPQFIKAAPLSRALAARGVDELLIHTGQHYDERMSKLLFDELQMRDPWMNLEIGSGSHGVQTGRMLIALDDLIAQAQPDWVVVFGDTNSTLAGALAATKLGVPCAHIEAGLRSFNRCMPEELNRVLVDHVADLLLCPSEQAVENLRSEGITANVENVGDIMFDAVRSVQERLDGASVRKTFGVESGAYILATCHRASNTASRESLGAVLGCLAAADMPVILALHPRTRAALKQFSLDLPGNVQGVDPLGYHNLVGLVTGAAAVMTDSGGLQKEAFWLGTRCLTMRDETEWVETVESGWNFVIGTDASRVRPALCQPMPDAPPPPVYGSGSTATIIAERLCRPA